MKSLADKISTFIIKNISKHPNDIIAVVSKYFSVTRTTAHRHLNVLIKSGKIIKTGATSNVIYSLNDSKKKELRFKIDKKITEDEVWNKYLKQDFLQFSDNIYNICQYGFTEMFNNALEHSEGKLIKVLLEIQNDLIEIRVTDDGVGLFEKIKQALKLKDIREGALHLSKGKFTTDPEHHTGEGIFFTSRAFDEFLILSNNVLYHHIVDDNDWFVDMNEKYEDVKQGTTVSMKIKFLSLRKLDDIFKEYYSNDDTYKFDKTHILVKLSEYGNDKYVSRSQAKRILMNLEKFEVIVLDFKGVKIVGQGFVDEVFRVFKQKRPNIKLEYINVNDDIAFMIKRGLE